MSVSRINSCLCVLLFLESCSGRYILKSSFEESPVPPPPDYSVQQNWASLPWKKDPADSVPGINSIEQQISHQVDVFFIHPTAFTKKPTNDFKWNASVEDSKLNRKVDEGSILYQASVFNRSCNIYAPRYRQAQISAFYGKNKEDGRQALDVAYVDVKNAFEFYLRHYSNGRPFIIASHSQGTYHAKRLIHEFFSDSLLSSRLVTAYLIGFSVDAESLNFIPTCESPEQTNCFCSWNTFVEGYYPRYYHAGLDKAMCTNPISWKTDDTYCPDSLNLGGVLRNFRKIRPALCDAQVHKGLLWIHKPNVAFLKLVPLKIYHVADINLFYRNIQVNVADRIAAFQER